MEFARIILVASWLLFVEMAPYLLLGFFVAGILSMMISPAWVERHLGQKSWRQIFKASLFGVPPPLCSCGVLPVAASLRRHGASRGSTTSFLLSTPQTGVDSIAVTWVLMGPIIAIIRPITAFLTGVLGGFWVQNSVDVSGETEANLSQETAVECGATDCAAPTEIPKSWWHSFRQAMIYGFVTLPRDIGKALVIGLLISGVISALIAPNTLQSFLGQGWVPYFAALLVGIPIYVCATASTPIAATLVAAGLSPGAALVFLVSGPATNSASITTLLRILGKKAVVLYLATVALGSLATGWLTDWILRLFDYSIPISQALSDHDHHTGAALGPNLGALASAVFLALVLVWALRPRRSALSLATQTEPRLSAPDDEESLEEIDLRIEGMRCQGCVDSVKRTLGEFEGVRDVDVALREDRAIVRGDLPDFEVLQSAVESLGFDCEIR